jgi:cysteine synthase A
VGSVLDLIGETPLIKIPGISGVEIYAKAEFLNPSGSIKDRIASHIVQQAELRGELRPGQTIVEATSGNTGVSLAMVAAIKGYKALIVTPDSISGAKRRMMELYGARLLLTDRDESMKATVEKAHQVAREKGAYLLNQFKNPDNPGAHRVTGQEIIRQLGVVDVFVAGVGTGGTLVGVGEVLKGAKTDTRLVAVEPYSAPALYNLFHGKDLPVGTGVPHKIEGVGETFVPDILREKLDLIDDVVLVKDYEAFITSKQLSQSYGCCVGVSSGANVYAVQRLAREVKPKKRLVRVLPDSGQRYLDQMSCVLSGCYGNV